MAKAKEKPSIVKFNKEAQNNGMTYAQYQAKKIIEKWSESLFRKGIKRFLKE